MRWEGGRGGKDSQASSSNWAARGRNGTRRRQGQLVGRKTGVTAQPGAEAEEEQERAAPKKVQCRDGGPARSQSDDLHVVLNRSG